MGRRWGELTCDTPILFGSYVYIDSWKLWHMWWISECKFKSPFLGRHIIFFLFFLLTIHLYVTKVFFYVPPPTCLMEIPQNVLPNSKLHIFIAIWSKYFWRSYCPFWLRIFHQKVCAVNSSYILNGNSSKLCMFAYHHMNIHKGETFVFVPIITLDLKWNLLFYSLESWTIG